MTDEARRALENAVTEEDVLTVVEKFKLTMRALSDEELDEVAGGSACIPGCTKKLNKCWC